MIRNGSWRTSSLDDILSLPKYSPYVFQSRRRRHRQHLWHPLVDKLETENVVDGIAHLSFPTSGAWFQGNLVCSQDCIYRVTGRLKRQNRSVSLDEFSLPAILAKSNRCFSSSDPSVIHPETLDDDFAVEEDDFDDEDLNNLSRFSTSEYYSVTIIDLDTGLNYSFENVQVKRGDSDCWLTDGESNQLRYESSQCFIGTSADLLVNSQLGPSFVELGLKVYKGELRFCYKDPVCSTVSVEASQWCL